MLLRGSWGSRDAEMQRGAVPGREMGIRGDGDGNGMEMAQF